MVESKNVLILGIDGYIGTPLALHLKDRGHNVWGIDNGIRRRRVQYCGSISATPIFNMEDKFNMLNSIGIKVYEKDVVEYNATIHHADIDCIVHLAEQPSAPYSHLNMNRAIQTQSGNVLNTLRLLWLIKSASTLHQSHLLKLGTMGQYGTPNCTIPEGFFKYWEPTEVCGEQSFKYRNTLPFPRQPGSFYHASKVMDSINIELACRIWGLRSTDIMQGVVYGTRTPELKKYGIWTRFDFGAIFGTVINRYVAQAIAGIPLTPYGKGEQKRGFIALEDSIQCLTLALENPPAEGEYRVFNQLDEVYSVNALARMVSEVGNEFGLDVDITNIPNPRVENEDHEYYVKRDHLKNLGFKPTKSIDETLVEMFADLIPFRERIIEYKDAINPKVQWK